MLKLPHVQARLDVKAGVATVRQMRADAPEDLKRATDIIEIFRQALKDGLTREKLYARLGDYTGVRLDYREIDGLAKVICDSFVTFEPGSAALSRQHPSKAEVAEPEADVDALLTKAGPAEDSDEDAQPDPNLTAFRLAVWREAARPEFYPFHNPGLTVALKPGVQSLRRAAAAYDAELLERLLPAEKRTALLQRAAQTCELALPDPPPVENLGDLLFGDIPARHRLVGLSEDLNVENLLNRYNVELLRGVLYLAPRLKIRVHDKYKDLFKYIKFFGLMHEVTPLPLPAYWGKPSELLAEQEIGGYEILLEGAASPFLARSDRRYGIQFAKFLPALLLCEADWELEAELVFAWLTTGNQTSKGKPRLSRAAYKLGPQPHLRTHFKGSGEFDSLLEAGLAAAFEKRFKPAAPSEKPTNGEETEEPPKKKRRSRKPPKNPDERQGWTLHREDRIVPVFDTVMIPDFSFEHSDGRRAMLEIVGFWERGYLERKIAKLNRAGRSDIIVLVSERTRCGRENFLVKGQEPPYQLIFFKGTPRLGPILEALERVGQP